MLQLNGALVSAIATRREGAVAGDGNSVFRCRGTAYFFMATEYLGVEHCFCFLALDCGHCVCKLLMFPVILIFPAAL